MIPVNRSAGAAVIALAMALAGCGTPGPPQPPSLNLPDPVEDLAAVRTGDHVKLTWTMPKHNTDRLPIKTAITVQVCRHESPNACTPIARLSFQPRSAASFDELLPAPLASGLPRPLSYSVDLQNRNGRSAGPSNAVVVLAGEAPGPVVGLAAEVRKSGVVLRWTPGPETEAVRIHRKQLTPQPPAAHDGLLAPTPAPVEQNLLVGSDSGHALDASITFGNAYEYSVQRVARVEVSGQTLELAGDISQSIHVDARDVFPPAVPTGLAAVATAAEGGAAAAVDLNWEPNIEPDLAGYYVYRGEDQTPWQRVSGDQPVAGPAFHDPGVQPGHAYRYSVSAVDRDGHESGRSAEAQETVPNP